MSSAVTSTVAAQMRAAVWHGGGVATELETIPVPVPKAGEALVRIAACGLCHTDLHVLKGEVAFPSPAVLGHEISGTIVALGPSDGTEPTLRIGDRVVGAFIMPCTRCQQCRRGREDLCIEFFAQNRLKGTLYDGHTRLRRTDGTPLAMYSMAGFAEYSVVPLSALASLSEEIPLEDAAILGCAFFTAYGATTHAAQLRAGEAVAIVGTGGVGSSLVQMARLRGADPIIAIDIADQKLDAAIALGATHGINSAETDAVQAVRAITDGAGVDVAFEALGRPQTFQQAEAMLADGGRMVAVGIAAGNATAAVEITPLVRRAHQITGSFGARTRLDLPEVVRLAAAGGFRLDQTITARYRLDQLDEAFGALAHGRITGRAIITMNSEPST